MSRSRTLAKNFSKAIAAGNISSTGTIAAASNAQYGVSSATAITVNTTTPTTICSTSITVSSRPILIIATGDQNPNQNGGFHALRLYRDSTAIGKLIYNENEGFTSKNCPFAISTIDEPTAGTYTYSLKAYQGSGSMTYGETGDAQAPTIVAVEIL